MLCLQGRVELRRKETTSARQLLLFCQKVELVAAVGAQLQDNHQAGKSSKKSVTFQTRGPHTFKHLS